MRSVTNDRCFRAKPDAPLGDCPSAHDEGLHCKGSTMTSKTLTSIAATIMSAAVLALPVRAVAQDQQKPQTGPVRYSVRILSTLGGTMGVGNSVNNKGWVAGSANLTGDTTGHAALWGTERSPTSARWEGQTASLISRSKTSGVRLRVFRKFPHQIRWGKPFALA